MDRTVRPELQNDDGRENESEMGEKLNERREIRQKSKIWGSPSYLKRSETKVPHKKISPNNREWDIQNAPHKLKRFELLNRGIYNGKWANQELKRGQDDRYLCDAISCQLGIQKSVKQKLLDIFRNLDMRSFKKYDRNINPSYTIRPISDDKVRPQIFAVGLNSVRKQYIVIFSICALLYNSERSEHQSKYYPGCESEARDRYGVRRRYVRNLVDEDLQDSDKLFKQFAQKLRFRDEAIKSCMEKLRQECSQL
jgi:hypothetical protein